MLMYEPPSQDRLEPVEYKGLTIMIKNLGNKCSSHVDFVLLNVLNKIKPSHDHLKI